MTVEILKTGSEICLSQYLLYNKDTQLRYYYKLYETLS